MISNYLFHQGRFHHTYLVFPIIFTCLIIFQEYTRYLNIIPLEIDNSFQKHSSQLYFEHRASKPHNRIWIAVMEQQSSHSSRHRPLLIFFIITTMSVRSVGVAIRRSIPVERKYKNAVFCRMSTTKSHYEGHSAETYESAYFYAPGAYTEHLASLVKRSLQLDASPDGCTKDRCLLDIGGGTGNFTRMIVEDAPNVRAVVVDPFLEQQSISGVDESESAASNERIRFVKAPGEEF